jgi:iron-sulfur cluster repair protein YtfE (RIC family)
MKAAFADSATQCLEVDHKHLDATLLESEQAAHGGSFAEARKRFDAFASGLVRHIDAEEDTLFPELEELEPGARGPTSVMRAEHEELRALLAHIAADLAAATPGWQASVHRLKETLLTHNTKEERMLYPMADAAARSAGRGAALAQRLRSALSHPGDQ